jgi:hypothetical protein
MHHARADDRHLPQHIARALLAQSRDRRTRFSLQPGHEVIMLAA